MCAAFRADDTADKEDVNWDLLRKTVRGTWYSNRTGVFGVKASKHEQQGLTKYIRSTLHRKGMWFPRTLTQTRASWEQPVPQPRQWEVDDLSDPVDIEDPEALIRTWQRRKRAAANQMTNEELMLPRGCTACFSRLHALSVIGSCVEVKGHNPVMKHLEEVSPVVFDPLTEEQNVCQRVTYFQVNRRTESVECTINELEDCVPMEVWQAIVQHPYKAVTISLLRLDPNVFNPPANRDVNCTSLRHSVIIGRSWNKQTQIFGFCRRFAAHWQLNDPRRLIYRVKA